MTPSFSSPLCVATDRTRHAFVYPLPAVTHVVRTVLLLAVASWAQLANCTTMAWQSPLDPPDTAKADFIDVRATAPHARGLATAGRWSALTPIGHVHLVAQVCEWVYLYIFTFELTVKIVAYGFLMHDGSYLRDAWCQLDFIVVSLAWIPIIFPSVRTSPD